GNFDIVVLMTGVGLRTLIEISGERYSRQRIAELLAGSQLVARGPKPVAALREIGLNPDVIVPEPNTWREIVATLDAELPVTGKRIAVQEYGVSNDDFVAALRHRGAEVVSVPIYRWALPEDLAPLERAVDHLVNADVDAAMFTSATQVHHLFQIAAQRAAA